MKAFAANELPKFRYRHMYRLTGLTRRIWQVGHPRYGRPSSLVGLFIGCLRGERRWYGFEIRVGGVEQGCIFMPENDFETVRAQDLGPYETP